MLQSIELGKYALCAKNEKEGCSLWKNAHQDSELRWNDIENKKIQIWHGSCDNSKNTHSDDDGTLNSLTMKSKIMGA